VVPSLVERLGYRRTDRVVIVTADDLGATHAANVGAYQALRSGVATAAGLMVPGPWARDAAARYRGEDVGVHLTLIAEHDLYRWGPVTHGSSLLDGDGAFPRTLPDLWEHADPIEVAKECRAQVERAVLWGFDVSHLSTHLDALCLRPELFDVYCDLAADLQLPLRLVSERVERTVGFPLRDLVIERGLVTPDRRVDARRLARVDLAELVGDLEAGVTELVFHPAADTEELRALGPRLADGARDLAILLDRPGGDGLLARLGARRIGYRQLREVAREAARRR
jgi:predicted glycoside hydrolase/deacetylase ChbG (UPF0249 family)